MAHSIELQITSPDQFDTFHAIKLAQEQAMSFKTLDGKIYDVQWEHGAQKSVNQIKSFQRQQANIGLFERLVAFFVLFLASQKSNSEKYTERLTDIKSVPQTNSAPIRSAEPEPIRQIQTNNTAEFNEKIEDMRSDALDQLNTIYGDHQSKITEEELVFTSSIKEKSEKSIQDLISNIETESKDTQNPNEALKSADKKLTTTILDFRNSMQTIINTTQRNEIQKLGQEFNSLIPRQTGSTVRGGSANWSKAAVGFIDKSYKLGDREVSSVSKAFDECFSLAKPKQSNLTDEELNEENAIIAIREHWGKKAKLTKTAIQTEIYALQTRHKLLSASLGVEDNSKKIAEYKKAREATIEKIGTIVNSFIDEMKRLSTQLQIQKKITACKPKESTNYDKETQHQISYLNWFKSIFDSSHIIFTADDLKHIDETVTAYAQNINEINRVIESNRFLNLLSTIFNEQLGDPDSMIASPFEDVPTFHDAIESLRNEIGQTNKALDASANSMASQIAPEEIASLDLTGKVSASKLKLHEIESKINQLKNAFIADIARIKNNDQSAEDFKTRLAGKFAELEALQNEIETEKSREQSLNEKIDGYFKRKQLANEIENKISTLLDGEDIKQISPEEQTRIKELVDLKKSQFNQTHSKSLGELKDLNSLVDMHIEAIKLGKKIDDFLKFYDEQNPRVASAFNSTVFPEAMQAQFNLLRDHKKTLCDCNTYIDETYFDLINIEFNDYKQGIDIFFKNLMRQHPTADSSKTPQRYHRIDSTMSPLNLRAKVFNDKAKECLAIIDEIKAYWQKGGEGFQVLLEKSEYLKTLNNKSEQMLDNSEKFLRAAKKFRIQRQFLCALGFDADTLERLETYFANFSVENTLKPEKPLIENNTPSKAIPETVASEGENIGKNILSIMNDSIDGIAKFLGVSDAPEEIDVAPSNSSQSRLSNLDGKRWGEFIQKLSSLKTMEAFNDKIPEKNPKEKSTTNLNVSTNTNETFEHYNSIWGEFVATTESLG